MHTYPFSVPLTPLSSSSEFFVPRKARLPFKIPTFENLPVVFFGGFVGVTRIPPAHADHGGM
jgi:hypothetical protein